MVHLVDSHCHINFDPLDKQVDEVRRRAHENGVSHMLCVAVDMEALPEVIRLAEQYDDVFASVGVHPNHTEGHDPDIEELVSLAQHPRVVAIGETGLDYYRNEGDMGWQHDRFRRHIEAAKQSRKPLIIHTRESSEDTLRILEEEGARDAGGVMHCFVEDWDTAKRALDIGFYISFSGIVTFRNAEDLRGVARRVPADRILVETDSPYLAPVPYRGKTNEPAFVRHVAECLAEVRGEELDALAETTTRNFFRLFASAVA
jgi:TatD DNase family protein